MKCTARRLATLEATFAPPPIPRPTRPRNLAVLTDAEVEFMAGLQERIKETGDYSTLTDAELEEAEQIMIRAGAE